MSVKGNADGVEAVDLHAAPPSAVLGFDLRLHQLGTLDARSHCVTLEVGIFCQWTDTRLANAVDAYPPPTAWQPDWYVDRTTEPPYVRDSTFEFVKRSMGIVQQYQRMRVTLTSDLDMKEFPFDTQRIFLTIRVPRAKIQGISDIVSMRLEADCPEHFVPNGEFRLMGAPMSIRYAGDVLDADNSKMDAINRKPEFLLELVIRRRPDYWLWGIVMPNFFCALLGLNVFLIGELNERITLIVTLILTFFASKLTIQNMLPILPYLTVLDMWLGAMFLTYIYVAFACSVTSMLYVSLGLDEADRRLWAVDMVNLIGCLLFMIWSTCKIVHRARHGKHRDWGSSWQRYSERYDS